MDPVRGGQTRFWQNVVVSSRDYEDNFMIMLESPEPH